MPVSIFELKRNDLKGSLELAEEEIKSKTYTGEFAEMIIMMHDDDSAIVLREKLKKLLEKYRYTPKGTITR